MLITLVVLAVVLLYTLRSWTGGEVPFHEPPSATGESTSGDENRHPRPTGLHESAYAEDPPTPVSATAGTPNESAPHSTGNEEQSPVPGMRIRGRVVDDRTEEPVPALSVSLVGGGRSERVSTGSEGEFETRETFPRGNLVVELSDLGSVIEKLQQEFDPDLSSDLGTLRVRIGPTIPLLVEPANSKPCTARLVESTRPSGVAGIIEVRSTGLEARAMLQGIGDREWPWIQVRPGEPPWLRYPAPLFSTDDGRPPRVEVRMCGTSSEGVAPVHAVVGVQPPARVVATEQFGVVSGSVRYSCDDFFEAGADGVNSHGDEAVAAVLLIPQPTENTKEQASEVWYERRLDSEGDFSFERVRPGSWQLLVHATNNRIVLQDLEVASGVTVLPPIQMIRAEREAYFNSIQSIPEHGGGGFTCIRLRLEAARSFTWAWLSSGNPGFWDLPAAEFEMTAIGVHESPQVKPFSARLSPPPGDLELRRIEPSDEAEFEFDVRDSRTDQRLDGFQVSFGPRGSIFGPLHGAPAGSWRLARDAPFTWSVWRAGYSPAFGDQRAFMESEKARVARCPLTPGWGASLLFRAGNPSAFQRDSWPWVGWTPPGATPILGPLAYPPLRGVRVEVDSDTVATSDEEGEVRLQLTEMPSRLTLRRDGWKLVGVHPSSLGRVPQYVVWMDRE